MASSTNSEMVCITSMNLVLYAHLQNHTIDMGNPFCSVAI